MEISIKQVFIILDNKPAWAFKRWIAVIIAKTKANTQLYR
jgi:hypothetical protein